MIYVSYNIYYIHIYISTQTLRRHIIDDNDRTILYPQRTSRNEMK